MLSKVETTKSVDGEEISFFELKSNDKNAQNVFILGVFHGDEPEGEYIIKKLMAEVDSLNSKYNLYFLPCLNPDGKKLNRRTNFNDVDLNRNYPTKNFQEQSTHFDGRIFSAGSVCASEPETKFMISLIDKYKPVKILSIHADLHLVDYDGPAKEIAAKYAILCGYRLVDEIGYATLGSFGTWAGRERGIPVITLETWGAKSEEDFEQIWQENRIALYNFINE
ncbi:MAG: DUF2817 domain-containing protein [Alphaproteobacteria bacterium]